MNFFRKTFQKLRKMTFWVYFFAEQLFSKHTSQVLFQNNKQELFLKSTLSRSSHRRCSVTRGVLGNFGKFTGKHLCQSLFFNKVAGLRPATLLKKRLWHRCFPVNFAKFLRTPFLQNTSG